MTAKNRKEAEPVFCQVAALRYAKVLNELGISKEAVLEAGNIFEKSQELKAALVNPVITKETKHNIIDKVFSEEMRTFLKVVCDHEKMTIAEQIFAAYEELQNQAAGVKTVYLRYTALPSEEQKKGISLILCQSEKGVNLINATDFELKSVDLEKAIEANHQLQYPSKMPEERKIFFANINRGFAKAIARCHPKMYYIRRLKWIFSKIKMGGARVIDTYDYKE